MRFSALIAKKRRHEAWYSLGLTVMTRYHAVLGMLVLAQPLLWAADTPAAWSQALGVSLVVAAILVPDRLVRWYRARWIDRLELPLDRESYANALDGKTRYARLRITVNGRDLRVPDIYGVVAHVVEASTTRVIIDSFTMQVGTRFHGYPAYNVELHRWFVLLTERILKPMASSGQIELITAEHREAVHPALPSASAVQSS